MVDVGVMFGETAGLGPVLDHPAGLIGAAAGGEGGNRRPISIDIPPSEFFS